MIHYCCNYQYCLPVASVLGDMPCVCAFISQAYHKSYPSAASSRKLNVCIQLFHFIHRLLISVNVLTQFCLQVSLLNKLNNQVASN